MTRPILESSGVKPLPPSSSPQLTVVDLSCQSHPNLSMATSDGRRIGNPPFEVWPSLLREKDERL